MPTDARFEAYGLADLAKSLEAVSVKQWQPGSEQREANIQTAAQANIAIAFAEFLLAESGTIVVESNAGQGRALHFYRSITFQLYRLANSFHVRLSQQLLYRKIEKVKKSAQRFTLFQGLLIQEILKCNWLSGCMVL